MRTLGQMLGWSLLVVGLALLGFGLWKLEPREAEPRRVADAFIAAVAAGDRAAADRLFETPQKMSRRQARGWSPTTGLRGRVANLDVGDVTANATVQFHVDDAIVNVVLFLKRQDAGGWKIVSLHRDTPKLDPSTPLPDSERLAIELESAARQAWGNDVEIRR